MLEDDRFRFLSDWRMLLPREGGAVLAVVGRGGRTTVLSSIARHLRAAGRRVLWTATTEQPVPFAFREHRACVSDRDLRERLGAEGMLCVQGPATEGDRCAGLEPSTLRRLRAELCPDVVLVEAEERGGGRVVWPAPLSLAVVVGALGSATPPRTGGPASGRDANPSSSLLAELRAKLAEVPPGVRPLPFLTGLAAFRDLDAMFALVEGLWEDPRVAVVCLGEMLGDPRREAADARGLTPARESELPRGERVWAVYRAALDDD